MNRRGNRYSTHFNMDTSKKKQREPEEGDFPLIVLRKRGPLNIPSIIRMSRDTEHFIELLAKYFSKRNILRINVRTKLQSESAYWFLYKRCLITGTLCKRIINQNKRGEANPKLNRSISRFFQGNFQSEAMSYGIANERNALDAFFKIFQATHVDAELHSLGVVLYKKYPYIGGSPDGLLTCGCCDGPYIVEAKCPYRLRETGIQNWRILEYFDDQQQLKRSHTYTNQINLYQGILGVKKAFFVVFAKNEVIVKMINFDHEFFAFQIENIKEYYINHYLPTVIGTKI